MKVRAEWGFDSGPVHAGPVDRRLSAFDFNLWLQFRSTYRGGMPLVSENQGQ